MTHPPKLWAGIDTHSQIHVLAVIDDQGNQIAERTTSTEPDQVLAAVDWLAGFQPVRVGVEGTSSYGAGITRALLTAGIAVAEVTAPNKTVRRRKGKTDLIDALQAADAVRTRQRTSPVKDLNILPRLRTMFTLRSSAISARTQVANQLHAAARALEVPVQGQMSRSKVQELLNHPVLEWAAQRWLALDDEAKHYDKELTNWLAKWAPQLLARPGVGKVSATQLILAAGGNPDRLHSDAAFAHLVGVAPIPCSSGKQQRWRLDRGGDRSANNALWRIAFHQMNNKQDTRTQTYRTNRPDNGKDTKGFLRVLKRAIVRELLPDLRAITQAIAQA